MFKIKNELVYNDGVALSHTIIFTNFTLFLFNNLLLILAWGGSILYLFSLRLALVKTCLFSKPT